MTDPLPLPPIPDQRAIPALGFIVQDPPCHQPTAMIPGTILGRRRPAHDREPVRVTGAAEPTGAVPALPSARR